MIPIEKLPDLNWNDIAVRELSLLEDDLVGSSTVAYRIGNVAVAGLIHDSFTSPPWFWFALAKDVTMRDLIDFRRFQEKIPSGALTAVQKDNERALRFATFYGFIDTGKEASNRDIEYKILRRA